MFKKFQLVILTVLIFGIASNVFASTYNTVDISTGIKADLPGNPVYSFGQQDSFWKVVATPNGQNLGSAYIPILSNYPFVAYSVLPGTTYINSNQTNAGNYEYERCFCLDNPKKAQLSIKLRADNTAKVFLNSYSNQILTVSHNDSFKKQPGVAKVEKGFVKGKNCLRVRVNNTGNITGMDAKIKVGGWGAKEVVDKCCRPNPKLFGGKTVRAKDHNSTRSNRASVVGNGTGVGIAKISKRKCIRQGGTYYEYASGSKVCLPAARAKQMQKNAKIINQNKAKRGWRRERRECWEADGVWSTNSAGTFCFRKLVADPVSF